ncbi:Membrane associated eicosanoid/glutathione metabolism-like domain protein [Ophiocordyceps sinensis CO18]|uniref:Membrane associated eicosanoid/glutathione metabolism-like domain protein n=1 Tax=Ophiocordyceps sinensis (strain Co18 / CGMCC 3.14243) TaxID=911162 RepID=T5AL70_OPHSC|nr:Membrane associated eicosanoid/glutathione metabolism-like domain protein [Ophiocordyceps sinensis CO18]
MAQIPAAFFLCWAPHMYAAGVLAGKVYDNANPRDFRDNVVKSEALEKATKQRILRAEGASQNGFESLGFFAAAVVAGNMAGLGATELNALSVSYVATRLAFVVVYVHFQTDRWWSTPRTAFWLAGIGLVFRLWIRAGLVVMRAGRTA